MIRDMTSEERYIRKRLRRARKEAKSFYDCRKYPINRHKIVFMNIEGTVGYGCNPKYICEEMRRRNAMRRENNEKPYDLVWLVDDISLPFPDDVRVVRNTLKNRAYELSTAAVWVDNSRKQLEVRKRSGQFYLQTWHGMIGVKPTGLDRGSSFSRIAYIVSKHDSDMIDIMLSNSDFRDARLSRGMLYDGSVLKIGSPRNDGLVRRDPDACIAVRRKYGLRPEDHIMMYAPTFRGGSQTMQRTIAKDLHVPDFGRVLSHMQKRFGGEWYMFLRLHPQLTARHIGWNISGSHLIDVSQEPDMYELLAACDAFLSDYSASVFDAAVMNIPIFLYVDDYDDYIRERGNLLIDFNELPFPFAKNDDALASCILDFDEEKYHEGLAEMMKTFGVIEHGDASKKAVDEILSHMSE